MRTKNKLIKTHKGFRIYKFSEIHMGDYTKLHENERYCIKKPWKFLFWTIYQDINLTDGAIYKLIDFYSVKDCEDFIKDYKKMWGLEK